MESLVKILGTYELFVNLIPGIIFIVLSPGIFQHIVDKNNMVIFLSMAYFIGVVINRIGSVFIEWLLVKKLGYIKYIAYGDYLNAETAEKGKGEHKLEELIRVNNLYRSFTSVCFCLIAVNVFCRYEHNNCCSTIILNDLYIQLGILLFLLILFGVAFKKQTKYIYDRVVYLNKKEES